MNRVRDNKRPIEQFFVAKPEKTTAHSGGVAFTAADGTVNFDNGQLRLNSSKGYGTRASNATLAAADTVTAAREVFITQGNPAAADPNYKLPYPLPTRPYEESAPIDGRGQIIYTYRSAALPVHDLVSIGDIAANTTTKINVLDETEYGVKVAFYGRDMDEFYAAQTGKALTINAKYTSKDYTTLGDTTAEAIDDIIQNLGYIINKNSSALSFTTAYKPNKPVIAFAVDSTGTQGIDPTTVAVGTFVPVLNTSIGLRGIYLTAAMINTLGNSDLPSGFTIVPIDLSLAGGLAAAGSDLLDPSGVAYNTGVIVSGKADHLVLMALDRELAFEDRVAQTKIRLEVGLTSGFGATVANVKDNLASEGSGLKRQLQKYWADTAGQRIYAQYRGFDVMKTEMPNPVTEDYYDVVTVEHYHVDSVAANQIVKPFKAIILVPNVLTHTEDVETGIFSFTFTPDSGAAAWVTTILLPWINSTDNPIVSVLG